MHTTFRRVGSGVAGLALVGVLAAGGLSAGAASKQLTTVAIATPAKTSDYGWNSQGVAGLRAAAQAAGIKNVKVVQNIGYNNTPSVLRQLAQSGAGLIIAHASGYDPQAKVIAHQFKVPTITYDDPTLLEKGDLSNITTSSQQGAYLAGILAAKTTKTGHIGVILSAQDPNWYEMEGGYAAGAHSVNPKLTITTATISAAGYDDSAGGKRVATSVIATGADVIFAMGDNASFGYLSGISAAKTAGKKVWYIGDIGDITPIDTAHVLLSSVLWNFTNVDKAIIADVQHGTFGTHGYNLTLGNGGISLLHSRYISSSVWKQIMTADKGIIAGTIKIPVTTTDAAAKKLLKPTA